MNFLPYVRAPAALRPMRLAVMGGALLLALMSTNSTLRGQSGSRPASKTPAKPAPQPDPAQALLQQAKEAMDKDDFAAAVDPLQKVLAARPDDPYTHFQLGYAFVELKREDDARAEFSRAIALDPTMAPAHQNLGLLLLARDPSNAAQEFLRTAELQPGESRPRYLAGVALEGAGKFPEAADQYRAALTLSPKDYEYHFALGRVLMRAGKAADAETEFNQAIAIRADSAPAHLGLANSLQAQKKYGASADEYAAYLKLSPADRSARLDRASALIEVNRFDDAVAELDRADAAPATASAESLKMRADIYTRQAKWPEAQQVLLQAVVLAPQDAELAAWLGHTAIELHQYGPAVKALQQALSLNPQNDEAIHDLPNALFLNQNYADAVVAMDALAKKEPQPPGSWFVRGICYDRLSRKAEAAEAYQKFLDLDGGKDESQELQAQSRIRELKREMAQEPKKKKQ